MRRAFGLTAVVLLVLTGTGCSGRGLKDADDHQRAARGVELVKDITPEPEGSGVGDVAGFGGTLFFGADDGTHGPELWRSDGTEAGTVMVKDIRPGLEGSRPRSLTAVGGRLYFVADDGTHGNELWRSDGTEAGTFLVREIAKARGCIVPGGTALTAMELTDVAGTLYFSISDGTHGCELWRSDGTSAGTVMVKDIRPGGYGYEDSSPAELTDVEGTLYFAATDDVHGRDLWKSDGTPAGTVLVKDILREDGPCCGVGQRLGSLTDFEGTLYLSAKGGAHNGQELWKSDGTRAGTVLVDDIRPGRHGSWPSDLTVLGGALYFAANDRTHGYELWKSDGTRAGTVIVKDIYPGRDRSEPQSLVDVGDTLYFDAYDGTHGHELWKSDGTEAGTVMVRDIHPGEDWSPPIDLTDVGGTLYFVANDGTLGYELWRSDGTEAGTVMVKDIWPGSESSSSTRLVDAQGGLCFSADDGSHGQELWASDGTADGTVMVRDTDPGPAPSTPREFVYIPG